jgi:hypothetical protein
MRAGTHEERWKEHLQRMEDRLKRALDDIRRVDELILHAEKAAREVYRPS